MARDKEKRKAYLKEYMKEYKLKNKEKLKEKKKEYYEKNKEIINKKKKEYYEKNKEKHKERNKRYKQSVAGKKSNKISEWKRRGLLSDDYDKIYERYSSTNHCDICNYEFDKKNCRCMDHSHSDGKFRQILCHRCNVNDNWMKVLENQN